MLFISNVLPLNLALTIHPHVPIRPQTVCIHSDTNVFANPSPTYMYSPETYVLLTFYP